MKDTQQNPFRQARYLMGAAKLSQLPPDEGIEIALAGRSNAGKSTALNVISEQKSLAKTSKTPGRTQLINLFRLDDTCRLVDLPGYGFARVSKNIKEQWQKTLSAYLQERMCLQALVIFADIRHPLKESDKQMIQWAVDADLPVHIALSKADKLKSGARKAALIAANKQLARISDQITSQIFSATAKLEVDTLIEKIKSWYGYDSLNPNLNPSDLTNIDSSPNQNESANSNDSESLSQNNLNLSANFNQTEKKASHNPYNTPTLSPARAQTVKSTKWL